MTRWGRSRRARIRQRAKARSTEWPSAREPFGSTSQGDESKGWVAKAEIKDAKASELKIGELKAADRHQVGDRVRRTGADHVHAGRQGARRRTDGSDRFRFSRQRAGLLRSNERQPEAETENGPARRQRTGLQPEDAHALRDRFRLENAARGGIVRPRRSKATPSRRPRLSRSTSRRHWRSTRPAIFTVRSSARPRRRKSTDPGALALLPPRALSLAAVLASIRRRRSATGRSFRAVIAFMDERLRSR